MVTLTLDSMNRLEVPKTVAERFGLKPGDELDVLLSDDGILLKPASPSEALAHEEGIIVCSSAIDGPDELLLNAVHRDRMTRIADLAGL